MKLFKYQSFLESNLDIDSICKKFKIVNYTINEDNSIDVDDDVKLQNGLLNKLPLKFRNVNGHFYCYNNDLTTLDGCPQTVGGDFSCGYNTLTTLDGCPQTVGGGFYCINNQLNSLEGSPEKVGHDFICDYNQLTTLKGAPKSIGGSFDCSNNKLTSLKGGPESVGGNKYYFHNNKINDLIGFPEFWEGNIMFRGNPIADIIRKFPQEKFCKAIYWINEFGVTHGGKVNQERLEEVFITLGLEVNI